ncbi:MAG TPA: amino acid adenylation domain-containing protein [Usitatibacter sp.]|nr:amino acid adenylation domain-containing protein [Usitatibacter sp.]
MTAVARIEDVYELTPLQEGMLFHTLYAPHTAAYTIQLDIALEGRLDREAMRAAWEEALARHAALRTSFVWERVEKPYQVVHRAVALPFESGDWSALAPDAQAARIDEWLERDHGAPYDLRKAPLMRLACFDLGGGRHRLLWSFHHIILEGWSATAVLGEVWSAYADLRAGRKPELPAPARFVEYVRWLRAQDRGRAEAYWREAMRGFRGATVLPIDHGGEKQPAAVRVVEHCSLELPAAAQRSLRELARTQRVTLNTVFQGAWAVLLARYSGDDDVTFGAVVSGRPPELPGAESIVGLFVNTLPARVKVDATACVGEWLRALQLGQAKMREFEHSALVDVQSWSGMGGGQPLFHTVLAFENWLESAAAGTGELRVTGRRNLEASDQPLAVFVTPGEAVRVTLMYDVERFDRRAVERMLHHYATLLEGFGAMPERRVGDVPMLTAAEREQVVVEWNRTAAPYPRDSSIGELIAQHATRAPDAVAVECGGLTLTYSGLDRRSNQVARRLLALGVGTDTPVAILAERGLEMIVALVGILKAGGAYLPLDPGNPRARLEFIMADAAAPVLVTQSHLRDRLPAYAGHVVSMDGDAAALDVLPDSSPGVAVKATDLAYVMYTSGSTGAPKGVCITHRGVVRLVKNSGFMDPAPGDTLMQYAPLAFDASTLEIWGALLNGCRLVVCPPGPQSLAELARVIRERHVSELFVTTALFNQIVDEQPECLRGPRHVMTGGEALSVSHARHVLGQMPDAHWLVNAYGPTENTCITTSHAMRGGSQCESGAIIGRPIANTSVYILDARMQPVPVGVTGEIYIGGDGLARGYLNRPDLDAASFVADPFGAQPGARLYRSGDLGRWREDGTIEFLGRRDFQVKVRGFRIELGEIEAALCSHGDVRQALVVSRDDEGGACTLVAYVVAHPGRAPSAGELREHLRAALPEPMVPAAFVALDAFPVNANGKVDRAALPAPGGSAAPAPGFVAPRTEREQRIADVWRSVLGLDRVGIDDNFFDLGGNSLLLLRVHGQLANAIDRPLQIIDLFHFPTIRSLANHFEALGPATAAAASSKLKEQASLRREALQRAARTPQRGGIK